MIGQKKLDDEFVRLVNNKSFPRFSILVGPNGSGKTTFINEFYARNYRKEGFVNTKYVVENVRIDTLREMIKQAHKLSYTLFIIPDADDMSVGAKNSLLKVVEECPNNNYFIMTLEDENNTLNTIKSRATIFHMEIYTPNDIEEYLNGVVKNPSATETRIVKSVCNTPGEVNELVKVGILDFYAYVEKVVDNIAQVSGANSFKIASKVALKKDEEGYDLGLFWNVFMCVCGMRIGNNVRHKELEDVNKYANGIVITSHAIQMSRIKIINKQMLFDKWLLEIRESWM